LKNNEGSAFLKAVYKVDKKRKYIIFYNKIKYFSHSLPKLRPGCFPGHPQSPGKLILGIHSLE